MHSTKKHCFAYQSFPGLPNMFVTVGPEDSITAAANWAEVHHSSALWMKE